MEACNPASSDPSGGVDAAVDTDTDTKRADTGADGADAAKDAPADAPTETSTKPDATGDANGGAVDCADRAARWATMLAAPIQPPRHYANLDLAGSGAGITLEEAEQINCLGTPYPEDDSGVSGINWGGDGGVDFYYDEPSHLVHQVQMGGAYTGTMTFKSRDLANSYVIAIGSIKKNGQPFVIDWNGPDQGGANVTELADAVAATFSPQAPPTSDCQADGSCLIVPDDGQGEAIFGFRPVHFYLVLVVGTSQPTFLYTGVRPDGGF
jgi:hypothetical protein